jgi:ABC-2 type transport system permease protein
MGLALVVLRKELLEQFGDRSSRRGSLVQAGLMVGVLGLLIPAQDSAAWLRQDPAAVLVFLLLPSMLAVVVAADSFAGERERRTLETLLATPLGDADILLGKAGAALAFALLATVLALALAVATVNLTAHPSSLFLPGGTMLAALSAGALSAAALTTALSIIVSTRFTVARSVQQIASFMSMALFGVAAFVWSKLGLALTWRNLLRADAVVFALALLAVGVAVQSFRRDRMFEQR